MFTRLVRRRAPAFALAFVALAALTLPAAAADTVTQTVTAGARTASVANLTLGNVAYAHTAQASTGTMVLTADDSTGSNLGWNVTVLSSEFVYTGGNGGTNIPAANFSLTAAAQPSANAGQGVDALGVGGPKVPALSPIGTLDSARKTVQAAPLFGKGNYSQNLGVSLSVPAQSAAGTYTGILTTTISAAP